MARLSLSLMSVSQRNTRLAERKGHQREKAQLCLGRERHLYLSLVKFQRQSEEETSDRLDRANERRTREQQSSSPIDCSLGPSLLPRKVETRQKKLCPSSSSSSKLLNWPNRKSVVGKQGGLCTAEGGYRLLPGSRVYECTSMRKVRRLAFGIPRSMIRRRRSFEEIQRTRPPIGRSVDRTERDAVTGYLVMTCDSSQRMQTESLSFTDSAGRRLSAL